MFDKKINIDGAINENVTQKPKISTTHYEIPKQCFIDYGNDLKHCSTLRNKGCGRCNLSMHHCWKISRFDSNGYIFDDLLCLEDELSDNLSQNEINTITKTIVHMSIGDVIEFYFHRIEENIKFERVKNMTMEEIEKLPEFNGW